MTAIPFHAPHLRYRRLPRHRFSGALSRVLATLRLWRRRAEERVQLARLDDHALHDIGITRADVLMLIDKPFWKE